MESISEFASSLSGSVTGGIFVALGEKLAELEQRIEALEQLP